MLMSHIGGGEATSLSTAPLEACVMAEAARMVTVLPRVQAKAARRD